MKAGMGFGEIAPSPKEERKEELPQGVRGLEDAAAFIPRNVEQALADLGYGPDARRRMTPEEAQGILAAQKKFEATASTGMTSEEKPKTYRFTFDERGEARLENEARLEKEAQELRAELERTPESEREEIGVGFRNFGFFVEEAKNKWFASVFNKLAETQMQEKSATTKFIGKLGTQFEKDAVKAHDRMAAMEKTKKRETLANAGYIVGNAVKLWTLVSGAVTMPLRAISMGGMVFARGADAAKEVRFENEKVIAQTRIEDMDKAAEEAWAVYLAAQDRGVNEVEKRLRAAEHKGDAKEIAEAHIALSLANRDVDARKITAKDLEKAYRELLPKDILNRLEAKTPEQPSLVSRVVQGFLKVHIKRSVKRLERKVAKIDENEKLTAKERAAKRDRLFNRFERRLRDYDRAVGQLGAVDALAMGLRYAEMTGKAVTYAPAAYLALEKGFHLLGGLLLNGAVLSMRLKMCGILRQADRRQW